MAKKVKKAKKFSRTKAVHKISRAKVHAKKSIRSHSKKAKPKKSFSIHSHLHSHVKHVKKALNINGRSPSGKSKDSKVEKLIRLARTKWSLPSLFKTNIV